MVNPDGDIENSSGMDEYRVSTVSLASKRITLSYGPASTTDENYLNSLAAQDNPPTSLPAYLIHVKPQLLIDGSLVREGMSVQLGATQKGNAAIYAPAYSGAANFNMPKDLDAGSYYALGMLLGMPSVSLIDMNNNILGQIKTKLENNQGALKDEVIGEMLHSLIISYYSETISKSTIKAISRKVFFKVNPCVSFLNSKMKKNGLALLSLPSSVGISDLSIDVSSSLMMLPLNGDLKKIEQFVHEQGAISSFYEGQLWKDAFPNDTGINPVSTVSLFKDAAFHGQSFFEINQNNVDISLKQIQGLNQSTFDDIRNLAYSGNIIIIYQQTIQLGGWTGFGYIVYDPNSLSEAYIIDGHVKGGVPGCYETDVLVQEFCNLIQASLVITCISISAIVLGGINCGPYCAPEMTYAITSEIKSLQGLIKDAAIYHKLALISRNNHLDDEEKHDLMISTIMNTLGDKTIGGSWVASIFLNILTINSY